MQKQKEAEKPLKCANCGKSLHDLQEQCPKCEWASKEIIYTTHASSNKKHQGPSVLKKIVDFLVHT